MPLTKGSLSRIRTFLRDGGTATPVGTENDSPRMERDFVSNVDDNAMHDEDALPCACLAPWYGSCPMITTLTLPNGVKLDHE